MCGIAGWIDNKNIIKSKEKVKIDMLNSLVRRGPDEEGEYENEATCLIHRRLSIIDLENGKQPMIEKYNGETYVIVYNGELYNTEEVRSILIEKGFQFKTKCDTEVLLKSYICFGIECVNMLNGIFAFAIYEENKKKLYMARDRMGVKPLFYYYKNDLLIFASQIETLLAANVIPREIDNDGLNELFMLGPGRTPGCGVYKGVHEIRRGEYAIFQYGKMSICRYWNVKAREHDLSLKEILARTKYLIEDSIKRQLISDVPVSTFLSGGLDSSIISKIAADYFKDKGIKLTTYSVNYEDNDKYFEKSVFQPNSDNEFISLMVSYIESEHKNVILDNEEVYDALKEACLMRGLPGMVDIDSSLLLLCKEIKKDFSVALSGECADEIFCGYPWYYNKEILYSDTFPWSQSLELRKSILKDDVIKDSDEYVRERYEKTIKETDTLSWDSENDKRMRQMFMLNVDWFMQTLLDRKDRMSMATGLEVRVPFCDYRLVEFAYNMPSNYKMLNDREKGIVREAMKDMLPSEIIERKKSPYPKTFNPIYMKKVSQKVIEIINDKTSIINEIIDGRVIIDYINNPGKVDRNWYGQLMRLPQILAYIIQLEIWFKENNVKIV